MSATAFQRLRREQAAQAAAAVKEAAEQKAVTKPLEEMTIPELRKYASAESIDLGKAAKKNNIVAVIKEAEAAAEAARVTAKAEAANLAAEAELQALRAQAAELEIEDVEIKDTEALQAEIASKGGGGNAG